MKAKFGKVGKLAAPQQIQIDGRPEIVQILPVKLQVPHTIDIYQITVCINYKIGNSKLKDYVVFERSSTSTDPKWKICGQVEPNTTYYIN